MSNSLLFVGVLVVVAVAATTIVVVAAVAAAADTDVVPLVHPVAGAFSLPPACLPKVMQRNTILCNATL